MSVPSGLQNMTIKDYEKKIALIEVLCYRSGIIEKYHAIRNKMKISDMQDGGMGSVKIFHPQVGDPVSTRITASFVDNDKIQISVALLCDENGYPSELDLAKGDFSPYINYPTDNLLFDVE
jgi:hypothetical protein